MTWDELITNEKKEGYFINLTNIVNDEYRNYNVYPPKEKIFQALKLTPLDEVKVVIIGQDPYQTPGYANGLAFSVNPGIELPKSLQNIFKEIHNDLDLPYPKTGDLTPWAKKGVLLLNTILTVREGEPLSHQKIGWEIFTMKVIETLNKQNQKIVFLLLGNKAKEIGQYLNNPHHLVLETSHPSPLGAYHGFLGSKIFSRACTYLGVSKEFWSLS